MQIFSVFIKLTALDYSLSFISIISCLTKKNSIKTHPNTSYLMYTT